MPEFYEVKRIKEYLLNANILQSEIIDVEFKNNGLRILKNATFESFQDLILGNQIKSISTKAKYTLIMFEKGSMLLHYRFTGIPHVQNLPYDNRLYSIYSLPILNLNDNYIRFSILFKNNQTLNFYDTRCLSHLHINHEYCSFNAYPTIKNVADDIDTFIMEDFPIFKKRYEKSSLDLKTFLLDQTKAPSGIGNYLANEILAYSNLNPWLKISAISNQEYLNLFEAIIKIKKICESSSRYDWFRVFNRKFCDFCNHEVMKRRHKKGAQSTFYCPQCQLIDK